MAGKVTNEPPPAMAFIAPPNSPAAASRPACSMWDKLRSCLGLRNGRMFRPRPKEEFNAPPPAFARPGFCNPKPQDGFARRLAESRGGASWWAGVKSRLTASPIALRGARRAILLRLSSHPPKCHNQPRDQRPIECAQHEESPRRHACPRRDRPPHPVGAASRREDDQCRAGAPGRHLRAALPAPRPPPGRGRRDPRLSRRSRIRRSSAGRSPSSPSSAWTARRRPCSPPSSSLSPAGPRCASAT